MSSLERFRRNKDNETYGDFFYIPMESYEVVHDEKISAWSVLGLTASLSIFLYVIFLLVGC